MAKEKNAPLIFAQKNFYVQDFSFEQHDLKAEVVDVRKNEHYVYHLDLQGVYQTKNIITVSESVHQLQLKNWNIKQQDVEKALKKGKTSYGIARQMGENT